MFVVVPVLEVGGGEGGGGLHCDVEDAGSHDGRCLRLVSDVGCRVCWTIYECGR